MRRRRFRAFVARLRRQCDGLAAVEFALTAPIVLTLFMAGAELTHYAIAKMRISQIALHVADNGSRIGTNNLLTAPQISETQINDLLIGANLQAGTLQLATRGRVIVSSLEPVASPNTTSRFKIRWQRCYGAKPAASSYGAQGATDLTGMGPSDQRVTAPDDGGVIFVEVVYDYRPLISASLVPNTVIRDIAAMTVRDDRDFAGNGGVGIYNAESATPSVCT
jgi:Flp pilus assembly protein TadG